MADVPEVWYGHIDYPLFATARQGYATQLNSNFPPVFAISGKPEIKIAPQDDGCPPISAGLLTYVKKGAAQAQNQGGELNTTPPTGFLIQPGAAVVYTTVLNFAVRCRTKGSPRP